MFKGYIYLSVSALAARVIPMLTSCLKDNLRPVGGGKSVSVVFAPAFNSSLDNIPIKVTRDTNIVGALVTGSVNYTVSMDAAYASSHNTNL